MVWSLAIGVLNSYDVKFKIAIMGWEWHPSYYRRLPTVTVSYVSNVIPMLLAAPMILCSLFTMMSKPCALAGTMFQLDYLECWNIPYLYREGAFQQILRVPRGQWQDCLSHSPPILSLARFIVSSDPLLELLEKNMDHLIPAFTTVKNTHPMAFLAWPQRSTLMLMAIRAVPSFTSYLHLRRHTYVCPRGMSQAEAIYIYELISGSDFGYEDYKAVY
ncbi:uncharacterized protein EDB93DRAFT_1104664 [Suillus bovinus]|uniref:uncharacterized protein n=1 Tax=Suillus bovinus TaxID=48563 RepID=UPI001B886B25|nr:uncharacterized protein EDB93DRAFT_1104664 [Suillus bovinus]KAG2145410.1 hypothetical protein EDB93DRAFT_1104664 [Suillus bovinus]